MSGDYFTEHAEAKDRKESCYLAVSSCLFYIIIRFINEVFQWKAVEFLGHTKSLVGKQIYT